MQEEKKTYTDKEIDDLFERKEMDDLRNALKRSYTERFEMMMKLIRMNEMFKHAKITHQPLSTNP